MESDLEIDERWKYESRNRW